MKQVEKRQLHFVMWLRLNKGFTLSEVLLALLVFMIMASLILQIMLVVEPSQVKAKQLNKLEWELFINNVKREVRMGELITVKETKMYINHGETVISIEQYGTLLRRRVDNTGHEVMLHNVKNFSVVKQDQLIILQIIDTNDKEYTVQMMIYRS